MDESDRPYSVSSRPRDIAGGLRLSCENIQGRPCGDGAGTHSELESAAGYGESVAAVVRVRVATGTGDYSSELAIDRAYLSLEFGPGLVQMGRDVLRVGPSARWQLAWGDNSPAVDHIRVSTARPLRINRSVRGSLLYVVGRLRSPQTYEGNLVTLARAQVDILDAIELGGGQLLQLGGDGAPSFGPLDFVLEHVRRRDLSAGPTDSSNRRLGMDIAVRFESLRGLRMYYVLMFEDARIRRFIDAVRYDADHQVGLEIGVGATPHRFVGEWTKTGVRSHEHQPRRTGFTNGGRVVGAPLGPDSQSLFASANLRARWGSVTPWLEYAWLASDQYTFILDGPINRTAHGYKEQRYRGGTRVEMIAPLNLRLYVSAHVERVVGAEFVPGASHTNVGVQASAIWRHGTGG